MPHHYFVQSWFKDKLLLSEKTGCGKDVPHQFAENNKQVAWQTSLGKIVDSLVQNFILAKKQTNSKEGRLILD